MSSLNAASILLVLTAAGAEVATAQAPFQAGATRAGVGERSVARAVRGSIRGIRIDGVLDEPDWSTAPRFGDFLQRDPDEGRPASERTEFQVIYTDQALLIAVRAFDRTPSGIAALLSRRDVQSTADEVTVMIDSYHDRRSGFSFSINAAGVKRDAFLFDDSNQDDRWDAIWDGAARIDSLGWVAEFRIPWSQLRFPAAEEHVFGFNVSRRISRHNETQYWRLPPKSASGFVSLFGDLEGLQGVTPPRRLEVLPYLATSGSFRPSVAGDPFRTGRDARATLGGDLKVGISSALTLAATINPDFGQVEADPAVVNLTAFESFFAERRPFFTEGFDVFRFRISDGDGDGANEELFYTRRIGRRPQGAADPRGGFVEPIDQTTILGAAKVSGKTRSGWTLGMLGALTAEESAHVLDATGVRHADIIEPRTGYAVAKVSRDFREGRTVIGVLGTTVQRSLPDRLQFLHDAAYSGGVTWQHRFGGDQYQFSGRLVGSRVEGSTAAILATQRAPSRYYQRPDADYLTLDSTRTSLSGFGGALNLGRFEGNWRWNVGVETRSPGLELNDLGFQQEADRVTQNVWINRRWLTPGRVFRRFNLNVNQWSGWTYGGERRSIGGNLNGNFSFRNYTAGWFGINRNWQSFSPAVLRGGPSMRRPAANNGWIGFETDGRRALRGGVSGSGWFEEESGNWSANLSTWLTWRPATNIDVSASPNVNWSVTDRQYLTTATIAGQTEYLFGNLRQTTTSMTLRSNLTFSPDLTLQFYAQPFISAGRYVGFRRIIDPRAERYADQSDVLGPDRAVRDEAGNVGIDVAGDGQADLTLPNPDFRVLSFRSNLVLRWEYQAGSTVFLVWQHGRNGFNTDGRFHLGDGVSDLFRSQSSNVLLLKVNYWLGL